MSIEDFIDNVMDKDFVGAEATFKDALNAKMSDAMEQEKIAVAGTMFGEEGDDADEVEWDDDLDAEADEEVDMEASEEEAVEDDE
jgi:hypothetical protein